MIFWFLWLAAGIFSIIAGILAIANPFAATLTAEVLAGFMFTFIGVLTLVSAFQDQGWGARIWFLLLGAVITILGINLITHPLEGMVTLTLVVAIMMMIIGIFRLIIAFSPLAAGARWILVIAGVLSIVLSLMILTDYPASAAVILGVLLAIELISNGVSLIFVALERRRMLAA